MSPVSAAPAAGQRLGEFSAFVAAPLEETGVLARGFGDVRPGQASMRVSTGRQRVDTEELGRAGTELVAASAALGEVGLRLLAVQLELSTAWAPLSTHAAQAAAELQRAQAALLSLSLGVAEYAAKVMTARTVYEQAETVAASLLRTIDSIHGSNFKQLYTSVFSGHFVAAVLPLAGEAALILLDSRVRGTAAATRSALNGSELPEDQLTARARMTKTQLRQHGVGLVRLQGFRQVGDEAAGTMQKSGDTTELMGRINRAGDQDNAWDGKQEKAGRPKDEVDIAHVDVTVVTRPDGSRGYLVSVPGSDFDSLNDGNEPNGLHSIADSATMDQRVPLAQSTAMMQMVDRALKEAGASEQDEVMLTGFSQGGMVAMNLAGNREFAGRYRIAGVTTYGTPTQTFGGVAPNVPVMHVKDVNDPVPVMTGDGVSENDQEIIVTTNQKPDSLMTHDGRLYQDSGAAVDRELGTTQEGRDYQRSVQTFLPEGARTRTVTYESTSVPYDDPALMTDPGAHPVRPTPRDVLEATGPETVRHGG